MVIYGSALFEKACIHHEVRQLAEFPPAIWRIKPWRELHGIGSAQTEREQVANICERGSTYRIVIRAAYLAERLIRQNQADPELPAFGQKGLQ